MKIGFYTFGRDVFCYGLSLCLHKTRQHLPDAEIYRVTPKTAKILDVLLFSCFWWEHVYLLANFLRSAGIKRSDEKPKIIIGGFNTFNPVPLRCYSDYVVCGDGENVLHEVILSDTPPPLVWHNEDITEAFIHVTNSISRIEIARGCKYRCKFCALAHLKPYREVPISSITDAIKQVKTRKVALFAPDARQHSGNEILDAVCKKYGLSRAETDVRLDALHRWEHGAARVGIEGISARLRKLVGKKYDDDMIIESIKKHRDKGFNSIVLYFILDLPTETDEDWAQFVTMMRRLDSTLDADDFMIKPTPNVFTPNPHTPLEYEPIRWWVDYRRKWRDAFRGSGSERWIAQMAEVSTIFGPAARILSMISMRGGEEFDEIENVLFQTKTIAYRNDRVICTSLDKLLKYIEPYGGADKYCGRYTAETAPWKCLSFGGHNSYVYPWVIHKNKTITGNKKYLTNCN